MKARARNGRACTGSGISPAWAAAWPLPWPGTIFPPCPSGAWFAGYPSHSGPRRPAQVFAEPSQSASLCLDCRLAPPPWEQVLFYGPYDDLLKSLILRFKFHAQLGLGHVLGQLLRLCLDDMDMKHYDLIVPIPLHPDRLRSRGFNQSLELARTLARSEYAPLSTQALLRTRNTPAQHSLPRSQRMHNLDGAFHADAKQLKGLSILLVDDILTTGATARAATQALLQAKAADVILLVLARA